MLIKPTPDQNKISSLLKMVDVTLEMIQTLDSQKFASLIVKDYYEVIRELTTVLLLQEGYKTVGEGSHKELLDYLIKEHTVFSLQETHLIKELRVIRNKIAYDGFFVKADFLELNKTRIIGIIKKLREIITKK